MSMSRREISINIYFAVVRFRERTCHNGIAMNDNNNYSRMPTRAPTVSRVGISRVRYRRETNMGTLDDVRQVHVIASNNDIILCPPTWTYVIIAAINCCAAARFYFISPFLPFAKVKRQCLFLVIFRIIQFQVLLTVCKLAGGFNDLLHRLSPYFSKLQYDITINIQHD